MQDIEAARPRFGARIEAGGARFAVRSGAAERLWLCLFEGYDETRIEMQRDGEGVFSVFVPGLREGALYGLRADGDYAPKRGLWFDPAKLLVDPYAVELDYPFRYNALMAAERWQQQDIASIIPKAKVTRTVWTAPKPPLFKPGGLIYEVNVRAFTRLHPDVPEERRGTIGALAHPAVIAHLRKLGVSAVELMPVTAAIDERHLKPLGLSNAWGYNPVALMALDPSLAPGGVAELRETVAALREAGIGVILDLVFNHTGESDEQGPTLSLRGLDANACYRHDAEGRLVNDTGTGNTLDCGHPFVRDLVLDALRHFTLACGVDGFRFDLATVLGRTGTGFDARAKMLQAIESDPLLAERVLIAEPWDVGPDGYQLGKFGDRWLEWNDRCRDDIRRFWRGDAGCVGALATRLAGSSDVFAGERTRSVNFVAAHDGMTLADLVAYESKHNEANGEDNRDGHDGNLSWNNGVEGPSDDGKVLDRRAGDMRAMLATLFASRGTIMLTAGDEFGRSQRGNNNAYAQDNAVTWLDWEKRDRALEDVVAALSAMRRGVPALLETAFLNGEAGDWPDVAWLAENGEPMDAGRWEERQRRRLSMVLAGADGGRFASMINGDRRATTFSLPVRDGLRWEAVSGRAGDGEGHFLLAGRTVAFAVERRTND
ncbi:MAG: glycogen debranching protein GlgX [Rhizobiaceae bacterium]